MHWWTVGVNRLAVAGSRGIHPIVVYVAIEDLSPASPTGKTNLIVVQVSLVEAGCDNYVVAKAFHPPLKCQDTILIVNMNDVATFSAETRLVLPKTNEFTHETQK